MRSVFDSVSVVRAITNDVVASSGTPTATHVHEIDTFGYNTGMICVITGTPTGTTVTYTVAVTVGESAASGGPYTAISGATGTATGFGTAKGTVLNIRLEGLGTSRLRYLQVVATATQVPTDKTIPVSAVALLARGFKSPVSNSATATAAA